MKSFRVLSLAVALLTSGCVVPPNGVIPAGVARVAFQSQCAQVVVECTSSWPTAVVRVSSDEAAVTETETGFLVEITPNATTATVELIGSDSLAGTDATIRSSVWSYGATDDDPCRLSPGTILANQADTAAVLATGFHYIRLRVENDILRDQVDSEQCGQIGTNIPSYDFVEVEIEVR